MNLSPVPIQKFFDNNGAPLVSGLLFTYVAGTSTKIATYTDSTGGTPNTNPIVLNFRGECSLWLDPTLSYKFVIAPSTDTDPPNNAFWTADNVRAGVDYSTLTQNFIGQILNPRTTAEAAASFTPINYFDVSGDSRRANLDATGATDVTSAIQKLLDAAGLASSNGDTKEVVLYPGTYKVTRLYMRYSNVYLRMMPGATINQTQTGITNTNTAGQPPAYAVIHINPLAYVSSPSSGSAGTITNVRIYGGGTVQGPYTTTHVYDGFALGIVSNDCHKCWVDGINVMGCGGENILLNPSAWTTCTDLRIVGCEVQQGGEVGINNARDFLITHNYVHDSWTQNGLGGNGDGGIIAFNRVRSMAQAGLACGGSGAADIATSRNIIISNNVIENCCLTTAGYAVFLTDDGATTVPKKNIRFVNNVVDTNQSGILAIMACDYAVASGYVEIEGNTFSGGVGPTSTGLAIIAGAARYNLRDNSFSLGVGNYLTCMDVTGGTPVVNLWSWDNRDVPNDFLLAHFGLFNIVDQQVSGQFTLTLTGLTTSPTTTVSWTRRRGIVIFNFSGSTGTSNATTFTLTGVPSYLQPVRQQQFRFPVVDNGTNVDGVLSITASSTITLFKDIAGAAFTNVGTKGLPAPYNISYELT